MCKIIAYQISEGRLSKAALRCETHGWYSEGVMCGNMCPIGRIEKAVEDGLTKLAEATK